MPFIRTGSPRRTDTQRGIADVYHSSNVYINNVEVALWKQAGSSAGAEWAGDPANISVSVSIDPAQQEIIDTTTENYVAEQTGAGATGPNKYYKADAEANGVKGNFAGTPNDKLTTDPASTGTVSTSTLASGLIPFLTTILDEAKRGMWRETGQGGRPSNANIVGLWKNLGYPSSGAWITDQTPWCMGFVVYALKATGYVYLQTAWAPDIKNRVSKFQGTIIPRDQGRPGDIVLWTFGHVNFIWTANNGKYSFIGGNQTPTSGTNNNPNDGDVTISWPNGCLYTNPKIDTIVRPYKP
jgi:hypothetical protein